MLKQKKNQQISSLAAVILLVVVMPGLLRLVNSVAKLLAGAEGRLAALTVDTNRPLGTMPRVWQALAQGGENLDSFLDKSGPDVAKLKPDYIRIDHIYDGFAVVSKNDRGLAFDWTKLDKTVKQILATGAKPFLSLSYMPQAIASGDITSEPRDWNDWSKTVEATVKHYSGDLGIENVYYEVWNEPDLFGKWKMGSGKDYKNLYYYAAKGAEKVSGVKNYKFGGPAITGLYRNWMDNFFPFILKNQLRLDFFSWHRYDIDPGQYTKDTQDVAKWIESQPYFSNVEEVITEMGPESMTGGENKTLMGAAHLVAVMRELTAKVKYGFSFAVAGNFGIIGTPRYQALEFLSRLGRDRLSVTGEGSWVKAIAGKDGNKFQAVVVNYDQHKIHNEVVPVTFTGLKANNFSLRTQVLGQLLQSRNIATTEAMLQIPIPMAANSVVWIELEPTVKSLTPSSGSQL